MGVVYEARDQQLGRSVALKTLLNFDADSFYRFKQEFRTLADVRHRNLVHLHELVQLNDGPVFFTMDLVAGSHFVAHVCGAPAANDGSRASGSQSSASRSAVTRSAVRRSGILASDAVAAATTSHHVDLDKLRPALRQVVEGLRVLHDAGKLHRDIKPSNVLVTPQGHVVILDFGVALELKRPLDVADEGMMIGTPAYMSPEQAMAAPLTPASDWYALGVMLYKALTGRTPFVGSALDMVTAKTMQEAPPPSEFAGDVPGDLEELAVDLLRIHPDDRPDAGEILRRLGAIRSGRPRAVRPTDGAELVGREYPLRALRDAFDAARSGRGVTVRVGGRAGMGKSALAQRFLDDLLDSGEAEVLSGRAYERESVPYKGIDSVVDALTQLLSRIEEREEAVATPRRAPALLRLFPVLRRVPSLAAIPAQADGDPERIRQRGFRALGELLTSLAKRKPTVVYVDDVQWGDVDSVALLAEIMRPAAAPAILIVMTYREEDGDASPFLAAMSRLWPRGAEVRDLSVGPLATEDAERLALARIGASNEAARRLARAIARESAGSPFLVNELSGSHRIRAAVVGREAAANKTVGREAAANKAVDRDAAASKTDGSMLPLTLGEIVSERLERLPDASRLLAGLVAVAGRPLHLRTLAAALDDGEAPDAHVERLCRERLVRTGFRDGHETLEPSHDRIRETLAEMLPASELRQRHARLARALEATAAADVEGLAVHLLGSGDVERGAAYAERAAESAATKLAFDRAALFYRMVLDARPRSDDEARPLRIKLAGVLEHSGRGAEAAAVYLAAATGAPSFERLALERNAAEQLMMSGRTDEGADVLHRVLSAVGLNAPRTTLGAVLSLMFHRVMTRLWGVHFIARSADEVSPRDRVRVDALAAVANGLSVVDVVLAASMQARFFRTALAVGDRLQVLRAASVQIIHCASPGGSVGKVEQGTYALLDRLEREQLDSETRAFVKSCRAIATFQRGQWAQADAVLYDLAAHDSQHFAGHQTRLFGTYALFFLGRLRDQRQRTKRFLADAERHGDLYTSVNLRLAPLVDCCLADDDPDGAREQIGLALASWSQRGFHVQHWKAMVWGAQIELYAGNGTRAYAIFERQQRAFARSLLTQSQFVREFTRYVRGCAAVAAAVESREERVRLARIKEARKLVRQLRRARTSWTAPLASVLRAASADASGDTGGAIEALRVAIDEAQAADMAMFASVARYRLGILMGGEEGQRLRAQAEDEMKAEGVRAPDRYAKSYVPGRPSS
jgi:hypothetical protein